jgi:transglutaminase-like putative cysteine protease
MRHLAFAIVLCSLPAAGAPASRSFRISHEYTVAPSGGATLFVPLPPVDDPWQRATDLVVEGAPFTFVHDPRWGNAAARIEVPADGIVIKVRYQLERFERGADLTRATGKPAPSGYAPWLEPDRLVPLNQRVRAVAAEITRQAHTPLDKARAVYAYVLSTMKYDKPQGANQGWGNGDILWACDRKYGNCTDFHALFIGLLRASGIPARFHIGHSVAEGAGGELAGYHCWADFYLDGVGWVPVDASEAWKHPDKRDYFFGHHDANRVQVSTGRDLVLPGMRGAPLNYFVFPYAEANGQPVPVKRTSSWAP